MVYQLPNGKVLFISIDEYLQLTDEDIQYLMAIDAGDFVNSYASSEVTEIDREQEEEESESESYIPEDIFEIPDFTPSEDYSE